MRHPLWKTVRNRRLAGWEIEFGQSAVEGGATHAEEARGFGAVSPGLSERGHEPAALVTVGDRFRVKASRLSSKLRREIRSVERVAFAVNHGAFDRALEFSHIARPVIFHQGGHGCRACPMDDFAHAGAPFGEK